MDTPGQAHRIGFIQFRRSKRDAKDVYPRLEQIYFDGYRRAITRASFPEPDIKSVQRFKKMYAIFGVADARGSGSTLSYTLCAREQLNEMFKTPYNLQA